MQFYSTNGKSPRVGLREALMTSLAPDGGLYMPESIPSLPSDFFTRMHGASFSDVAFEASKGFFTPDIPEGELRRIVDEAFDFPVPLVSLGGNVFAYELFHGPTCAFKDFAARFMARLFGHFIKGTGQNITVLVATSGDTGSAVASGFFGVEGVNVVILYPSGKVSAIQEKQLTGMGGNVRALEVAGTFDDCQRMVKQAFGDKELHEALNLISANSINIARLLPQMFYYHYLAAQFTRDQGPLVVSVPSGNFGNLTAGLIAKRMGAPIDRFVAATNANDTVPQYLDSGIFTPKPSVATISNAMDVGNPSNFARMLELYNHDVAAMRRDVYGVKFTDDETRAAIAEVYKTHHYIMDPHGAVAYLGLAAYRKEQSPDAIGVFVETAHPAKFADVVEPVIGESIALPPQLEVFVSKEKQVTHIPADFAELKGFLLS